MTTILGWTVAIAIALIAFLSIAAIFWLILIIKEFMGDFFNVYKKPRQ